MTIFGYDVSWYQDNNETPVGINWQKVKDSGASFVIIKCGQNNYMDEDFRTNWSGAKSVGIPRGSYWFCDDSSTGVDQARKWWSLIKSDLGEGIHFADYEGGSWTDWNQLYNFIVEFQQLSGLPDYRLGIYTGYYYWTEHSPRLKTKLDWFGKYNLWEAWYGPSPLIPAPWSYNGKGMLIHQTGTPPIGVDVGMESREVDYDVYKGSPELFKYYFGSEPNVPPEGEKVVLYYADLKTGYTSNVRQGPGTTYLVTSKMIGPQTVSIVSEKVTADGYDWYQISAPNTGWIALTSSYSPLRPASSTPPEAEAVVTFPDGTVWKGKLTKQ